MKHILVIDDDPGQVVFLQKRLEAAGYRVTTAVSGEAGLEHLMDDFPDLVIADVMMPNMDGFSLIREIRVDPVLTTIPVIIVTAQEELADLFKMEGARAFFAKPIDTELLMEKIRELIG